MPNLSPFHVKACSLGAAVKISKVPATEMMRQSAANLQLLARSPRIAVDESQLLPGRLQVQLRWATEHRLFIKILPVNPAPQNCFTTGKPMTITRHTASV